MRYPQRKRKLLSTSASVHEPLVSVLGTERQVEVLDYPNLELVTAAGEMEGELLALLLLSVPALEHHDGYTEQDEAERQHDPGFERDRQHPAVDGEPQPVDGRARET